jgi:hypothetical protein
MMGDANTPRRSKRDIGRILGPIAAVCTIVAFVIGAIELQRLVEGPTVDAGRWFTVNDVHYRVDVIRNNRNGLVVALHTRNTEDTTQYPGRAIFKLVVRAGDERVEWDCEKLDCMGGPLRPGASRTSTLEFLVTRPADSLEFVDTSNQLSGRVARIRLRPTPG